MKINKITLAGIILIIFGGLLFTTNILNPIIRPITYLFLMGSSKGKDILFFVLFGALLIISQIKIKNVNTKKFLLITIISGTLICAMAIFLDIYLRLKLGIDLNTIFVNINPSFSTTSILHSHLQKSVLGEFLTTTIKPLIKGNINTATGLYQYVGEFTIPLVILGAVMIISSLLSIEKRDPTITVLLCFFETVFIIGCFDGGIMGTPGALGLFGCIWIYMDEKYFMNYKKILKRYDSPIKAFKEHFAYYRAPKGIKSKIKRYAPFIIGIFIIILRISISVIGANPEYYEVIITNPSENINLEDEYPVESVNISDNKIIYHIGSSLNEHELSNDLLNQLNNSCDYYTVSWNCYSYI